MNWELTIAFVSVLAAIGGTWTTLWFRAGGQSEKLSGLDKDLGELREEAKTSMAKWDSTAKRLHSRVDEVLRKVGDLPCGEERARIEGVDDRVKRLERIRNGI